MVEIKYEDGSVAQYFEAGDKVEITRTAYYQAGNYAKYKKGVTAEISRNQFDKRMHPAIAFHNLINENGADTMGVPNSDLKSNEKARVIFTNEEAKNIIFSYDKFNKLELIEKQA